LRIDGDFFLNGSHGQVGLIQKPFDGFSLSASGNVKSADAGRLKSQARINGVRGYEEPVPNDPLRLRHFVFKYPNPDSMTVLC